MNRYTFRLFLVLLLPVTLFAQRVEVGGWVGAAHYFGDLNPNFGLQRPGVAGGIMGRYNFDDRISLKGSINYGRVSYADNISENAFQRLRNLSFRSDIYEGALQVEFNFLPYQHGSRDKLFAPYFLAGIGVFNYNPQAQYNGRWVELSELGTEGQNRGNEYLLTEPMLLYGFGLKWDFKQNWALNVELGFRHLFTDYLDDVSTKYPDLEDLSQRRGQAAALLSDRSIEVRPTAPIGQVGRQRGDANNKDSYVMLGIGIVYNFIGVNCPSFYK